MTMVLLLFQLGAVGLVQRGLALGRIFVLLGNMVRQIHDIVPNAIDEGRPPPRQPCQAQEVDPGLGCNTALVLWLAVFIERVDLQPTEINGLTRGPDDCGNKIKEDGPLNGRGNVVCLDGCIFGLQRKKRVDQPAPSYQVRHE